MNYFRLRWSYQVREIRDVMVLVHLVYPKLRIKGCVLSPVLSTNNFSAYRAVKMI